MESTPSPRWAPSDRTSSLQRWERSVLTLARRRGTVGFVMSVTAISVAASMALSVVILAVAGGFAEGGFWRTALALSGLVPLVVAPAVTYTLARLVERLDALQDEMHLLALTDTLTSIDNRRGFFERVAQWPEDRMQRLLIVDIDDFKAINDSHGHVAGDSALRQVADWLTMTIGDRGHVARFGGDEFIAIADPEAIEAIPPSAVFMANGFRFSASTGRSCWTGVEPIEAALARADEDLYAGKAS